MDGLDERLARKFETGKSSYTDEEIQCLVAYLQGLTVGATMDKWGGRDFASEVREESYYFADKLLSEESLDVDDVSRRAINDLTDITSFFGRWAIELSLQNDMSPLSPVGESDE